MQRGDLVTVASQGDFGKPRPALVIQSDLLNDLDSIVLCPVTSELRNAAFRVTMEPSTANGLGVLSPLMVDKVSTRPRAKVIGPLARIDDERMKAIDRALLLVVGLIGSKRPPAMSPNLRDSESLSGLNGLTTWP